MWLVGCLTACGAGRSHLPPQVPGDAAGREANPWGAASLTPLALEQVHEAQVVLSQQHRADAVVIEGASLQRPHGRTVHALLYVDSPYAEWEAQRIQEGNLDEATAQIRAGVDPCGEPAVAQDTRRREQCEVEAWPNESIARTADRSGCLSLALTWGDTEEGGRFVSRQSALLEPAVCEGEPRSVVSVQEFAVRDADEDGSVEVLVRYQMIGRQGGWLERLNTSDSGC